MWALFLYARMKGYAFPTCASLCASQHLATWSVHSIALNLAFSSRAIHWSDAFSIYSARWWHIYIYTVLRISILYGCTFTCYDSRLYKAVHTVHMSFRCSRGISQHIVTRYDAIRLSMCLRGEELAVGRLCFYYFCTKGTEPVSRNQSSLTVHTE